jgi:hypothetical protein
MVEAPFQRIQTAPLRLTSEAGPNEKPICEERETGFEPATFTLAT